MDALAKFEGMTEAEMEALSEDDVEREQWFAEEKIEPLGQGQKISHVELDLYVDNLLERARRVMQDQARNKAVYDRRLAELNEWYEGVQGPLGRRLQWLDSLILPMVRLMKMPGHAKSRTLPNGAIGTRAGQPSIEFTDKKAAVQFCKKNALEIKEEPYKKPLLKLFAAKPKLLNKAEEFGIVFVEGGSKPFWKVPEMSKNAKTEEEEAEGEDAGS
jgi:hypothetical protein